METKEFYKPIKSLVNLILTGEKEINVNNNPIIVTQEFLVAISEYSRNTYNLYFLNRIESFLESCNNNDRCDLLKFYQENNVLLIGASILNEQLADSAKLEGKDFSEILDSMFSDYIVNKEVHPVLCFAIYFYVENLSKINIVNGMVSRKEYQKAIKFNSIKRDVKDVYDI
ncbi:hypothetical protein ACSV4D_11050 [Flavobacterium sp. ARAG 55.4]|uniref:hypothetical protein n=1 Tax=Flavobacterium sp. ARAG 55.4 TaxID=3451357 RepID=UPI003F4853C5